MTVIKILDLLPVVTDILITVTGFDLAPQVIADDADGEQPAY